MAGIDRDRSCWMCGYFGRRSIEARQRDGLSGRCHGFDDHQTPEFLGITDGTERETACKCPQYFRRSEHLTVAEFLAWRGAVSLDLHRQVSERQFRVIALLLSGAALIDFTCKALGIWR